MVCSCGCTFNRKVWHTTSKGTQYGYMCYSQIRNGTIRTRLKKGLPTDGICTSQMIPGWKLQFLNMKSEVDTQIDSLQEQICELSPTEKVTETSDVPDYNERITLLRYALERYTNFDSDEDIPEVVIEAFVEKIVVNKNSFDWYLHFSGDDKTPKTCNVEGDRKTHKIELFGVSYAPALVEGCSGCNR